LLHETGYTVSHLGFHRHGAYILEHADMPGFSSQEQRHLALLTLGCRGGLQKMAPLLAEPDWRAQIAALRLAVLFHHARRPIATPRIRFETNGPMRFGVSAAWLRANPLTAHLLAKERLEWAAQGHPWKPVRA
jgi:exopolyphosphatase/guanosine-5'-triphosphate,3'-diphosphate pyrophosphatase